MSHFCNLISGVPRAILTDSKQLKRPKSRYSKCSRRCKLFKNFKIFWRRNFCRQHLATCTFFAKAFWSISDPLETLPVEISTVVEISMKILYFERKVYERPSHRKSCPNTTHRGFCDAICQLVSINVSLFW